MIVWNALKTRAGTNIFPASIFPVGKTIGKIGNFNRKNVVIK
jgi:hypothetical protein